MQMTPRRLADALRILSIDAIEKAGSGHPGMPMGMADIAVALWQRHLRHNPANPDWVDRDRFVLSNGHGSMLLYSLLHLTGYDLPMGELRIFRQLGSRTPGHPEHHMTPGVEATTGPLGQGFANAVGMAIGEKVLADRFNQPSFDIVDHYTYAFAGDGCLMEGVSHEAGSIAGTLELGKLVVFYDDNRISIDGNIEGWFTDDTGKRFEAYGWQVIAGVDGHDIDAVDAAIVEAKRDVTRPTLICCRTTIGKGSPDKAGTAGSHGSPLGSDEVLAVRRGLAWSSPPFEIPDDVYAGWSALECGQARDKQWTDRFDAYRCEYPELAAEFERRTKGELPEEFAGVFDAMASEMGDCTDPVATRKVGHKIIARIAGLMPELIGGSADLSESTLMLTEDACVVSGATGGNYIYYGVREFGMATLMNGLMLHGGHRPFGGTYMTFSDYMRNGIRLSALGGIGVIYVLTHDSIGLGEDGPTHQPIEHLNCLRAVPNLDVWRPADAMETVVAWKIALRNRDRPTVLAFSRQATDALFHAADDIERIEQGGYSLVLEDRPLQAVIIATGTEVALAVSAQRALSDRGLGIRVVSMPSTTTFDRQSREYQRAVLPPGVPRLSVEAGRTDFWRKYVGLDGRCVGIDEFGQSAPAVALFKHYGLTSERIQNEIVQLMDESAENVIAEGAS